jgi:hypothetical protein
MKYSAWRDGKELGVIHLHKDDSVDEIIRQLRIHQLWQGEVLIASKKYEERNSFTLYINDSVEINFFELLNHHGV